MDYEFSYQKFNTAMESGDPNSLLRAECSCDATQQHIKEQIAVLEVKLQQQIDFGLKLRQKRLDTVDAGQGEY